MKSPPFLLPIVVAVVFLSESASGCTTKPAPTGCTSLKDCLAKVEEIAQPTAGYAQKLNGQELALARRLACFDVEAVPYLAALLSHPRIEVAELAAYALGEVSEIDPRHMPQLQEGLDRDIAWLPRALARVNSNEVAQEAVARFLISRSSPYNQEAWALRQMDERAIPAILDVARCETRCPDGYIYLLGAVLAEMSESARTMAAQGLIEIAKDDDVGNSTQAGSLHLISSLMSLAWLLNLSY